ncbi:hypothetical protein RA210_U200018 [Rubrivivax sp. A210]|uniref:glycosyltransferase n=1 Tax=Rubrivivax sp. A210 TaxID=2772301 RepID=UPI00191883C5|nr:glycosyltransferase [Rubrivivax sp. A210]CAD5372631.1 hypothetical protein RA210_U200018 [Rubrivivax sp. A210]
MTEPRTCAPIALFAYARPEHTKRTLDALAANELAGDSDLIVYSDAARTDDKMHAVQQVRELLDQIDGFKSVRIVRRDENLGLAKSIISGVSELLSHHERVVVVEDDLVVSPHFLRYMNDGLECYATEERVACIHGYCYPVDATLPESFFLRGADCWGWATWRRAWAHFNPDGAQLRDALLRRNLVRQFELGGVGFFFHMLEQQIAGRNDSWAIRWHASCFLDDMLTLYPGRTLVHNIGNDGSGTHAASSAAYDTQLTPDPVEVRPMPLVESTRARDAIAQYFRRQHAPFWRRWLAAVRDVINP